MQLGKSSNFQFVKIENEGRLFFCLQQSLAVAAWILFFKRDIFQPIVRSDSKTLSPRFPFYFLRKHLQLVRTNLQQLYIFARYKYQWRKADLVVNVPVYGHIGMSVHKGYKIFDLRRQVVAKVFDHEVDTSNIVSEIEGVKKVSQIDFAPSLKRWNAAEGWYEEDYVNGSLDSSYTPLDSETLLQKFSRDLVRPINSLILFEPPIVKNSLEYVSENVEILGQSRLSKQDFTLNKFNAIKSFIDLIVERLRIEGNCSVFLVFTHGDFCPANMLNVRQGFTIIDWESAGNRSVLFDLYSYFFYRPVSRNVPVATVASELNEALPMFISNLEKKAPPIFHSLTQFQNVYRWIYYVEQICKTVEREMTDKNLDMLGRTLRYIDAFNAYEKILTDNSA